jgi:hypothetical protein
MSHDENFKDSSGWLHLIVALLVFAGMPLLPMLMGWFTLLS